jgi:hypothetical protein
MRPEGHPKERISIKHNTQVDSNVNNTQESTNLQYHKSKNREKTTDSAIKFLRSVGGSTLNRRGNVSA